MVAEKQEFNMQSIAELAALEREEDAPILGLMFDEHGVATGAGMTMVYDASLDLNPFGVPDFPHPHDLTIPIE